MAAEVMEWKTDKYGCHIITSENPPCRIWIMARPAYCDRGSRLAHLEPDRDPTKIYIDAADLWPRYYFDLDRAKLECEAWLRKRAKTGETSSSESSIPKTGPES